MPTSTSGRDSKRSSRTSTTEANKSSTSDRRAKAQSQQIYKQGRRPSQQVEDGLKVSAERPGVKSRTNSAPLVQTAVDAKRSSTGQKSTRAQQDESATTAKKAVGGHAQDDDEVAGVVGAIRHFQPFRKDGLAEPLPDINIAVIGAERVGKSTFMQNALDLPFLSDSQAVERKIGIDGNDYLLRLLEIPIDEIVIEDDDTVSWPETIEDKFMPRIDGALTLYDVKDQGSLENIPEMLSAIDKAGIPSLLVSCKCDALPEERDVNPRTVELAAKRNVKDLETLRVSSTDPDSHRQGVSMILKAIVSGIAETSVAKVKDRSRTPSPNRRRAQSSAILPMPTRSPPERGHSRGKSEYSGSIYKDQLQSRHDSKLVSYNSSERLETTREASLDDVHRSFLIEESSSETSEASSQLSEDFDGQRTDAAMSSSASIEEGVTFDELVDRLLAQPMSKADDKFAAIFLALYRKFAPPGQLLEAIVQRYDDVEQRGDAYMLKTINQSRYLSVLERWLGTYPGDFAHQTTYRRIRTFVHKLSQTRIFAVAAKEMTAHFNLVQDDDDTNWACCDKDTPRSSISRVSLSSTASTLIDDPAFSDGYFLSPTPWEDDDKTISGVEDDGARSASSSSLLSQHPANAEAARKQANLLQPIPRQLVTKLQWHTLMDSPDEAVARELTRIDWIMFLSIRPRDLVREVSLSKDQKLECRNLIYVNRMVEHFNQLAFWVANFILLRDKPKHRALMLEKFMRIARKLREMNNYNALGAVIAGIKSTAIHRLAVTRELIPPTIGRDWMKLEILMAQSRSHSAYRLAWENSSAERIPYLPLHRRDLVSAEEGNKTFIGDEKDGKINWQKFKIMGEVVVSIQKAQSVPFRLVSLARGNEQLKELILDVKLVKDEDELFARSKQLEPSGTPAVGTTAKFKELFKR